MRDIQFISYLDAIEATEASRSISDPSVVFITVAPLATYINNVFVNDVQVTSFTILDRTTLRAVLPSSMVDLSFSQITFTFTTSVLTALKNIELYFSTGSIDITPISGIQKLSQHVVKLLLTSPLSNAWDRSQGSRLMDVIGATISVQQLTPDIMGAVSAVEATIFDEQTFQTLIPEERLVSLTVSSLDTSEDTLTVNINMLTAAGTSYEIPIAI